ncbi:hypothetical protein H4R35_001718 [Dimargaris xerosporica]|nr:hypothetical protein H4R35_001718 [Dimargaris xerosporica]
MRFVKAILGIGIVSALSLCYVCARPITEAEIVAASTCRNIAFTSGPLELLEQELALASQNQAFSPSATNIYAIIIGEGPEKGVEDNVKYVSSLQSLGQYSESMEFVDDFETIHFDLLPLLAQLGVGNSLDNNTLRMIAEKQFKLIEQYMDRSAVIVSVSKDPHRGYQMNIIAGERPNLAYNVFGLTHWCTTTSLEVLFIFTDPKNRTENLASLKKSLQRRPR